MCLIGFAYQCHPDYPLLMAGNRDEFYTRPSAPLDWWHDGQIAAGRDLSAGGTWMGVSRHGRVAALTNFRDPTRHRPHARSRGELVSDFLQGTASAPDYLDQLMPQLDQYNDFNLLVFDGTSLWVLESRYQHKQAISPGIHVLSNHRLNSPWPKAERVRHGLEMQLQAGQLKEEAWLRVLSDREPASDADLPDTGIGLEWERLLSPPFIHSPTYGTRAQTLLWLGHQVIRVVEHSHNEQGRLGEPVRLEWPRNPEAGS